MFQIETIVGQFGLVVITRMNSNPLEFIYNSDLLTKYYVSIKFICAFVNLKNAILFQNVDWELQ